MRITRAIRGAGALAALLSAGCTAPMFDGDAVTGAEPSARTDAAQKGPGERRVAVQAALAAPAEDGRPSAEEFLTLVRRAMTTGGGAPAVGRVVERWPDAAVETLRDTAGSDGARPDRLAVAEAYDRLGVAAGAAVPPEAGWTLALRRQAADLEAFAAFRRGRARALALLSDGKFAEAAVACTADLLPKDAPAALVAEAERLTGLALLAAADAGKSAGCWERALTAAAKGSPHARMEFGLLLAECRRRLGQGPAAAEAWRAAVLAGATVRDPGLWDRAVAQRPPDAAWPAEMTAAWIGTPGRPGAADDTLRPGEPPETGAVLVRIGRMRVARGTLQPALLAFTRAETEFRALPRGAAVSRLYQAQTMAALAQVSTAVPMLERLVADPDPTVARRSQAVLGDLLCRTMGDYRRGLPILREAVAATDGGEWPDKSRSVANLGLYCLCDGQETEGLRWLREAQGRFLAEGRREEVANLLRHEAAALRSFERAEEAEKVQSRADAMCRELGLPEGPLAPPAKPSGPESKPE